MAVYTRPDSPYFWMWIEGTAVRESTGVPRTGGSPAQEREPRRQAEEIYAHRKAEAAKEAAGLVVRRPTIGYQDFSRWFEGHEVAHHRAAKESSILRQLGAYFDRFDRLADRDLDAVKEWMTWQKRQVAPGTVNRELDVLKRLLAAAVPKYLEKSPAAGLRRFRVPEAEPRILTLDEERRLLEVGDAVDVAWLTTALDTLLRLSNIVHLQ